MTSTGAFLNDPGGFATGRRRRAVEDMPPCNIVVVGKTGVGKSTLINAVFGERLAKTGVGEPVTEHFDAYVVEGLPVEIVDSRGIELKDDLAKVLEELVSELDRRLTGPDDKHLHVLWYCVAAEGARFEPEAEGHLIRTVADRLPTVIVLTKAYDADDADLLQLSEYIESLKLPLRGILPVLAEPRYGQQAHGVEALIALTEKVVPEGVRRAFVNAQVLEIETKMRTAFARVDELVDMQDDAWRAFAFLRSAVGRGEGEDLFAMRVLDVVAEVSAVFGAGSVTDEQVSALALAAFGNERGDSGLQNFLKIVNRVLVAVPPVGPTAPVKYGGKLLASLAAALVENHFDRVARTRAKVVSRILGRAAARVFADVARADLKGSPLDGTDIGERFKTYRADESSRAGDT